jgi:cytochrome c553
MKLAWILALVPFGAFAPAATTKQLMLDMIHPAANDILLLVYRGGPKEETDWSSLRRNALTLSEAGNLLIAQGPAQDEWRKDAKMLADAGAAAYKAAQANDAAELTRIAEQIDASCTACHRRYRPDVFPRPGGSK